MRVAARKGRWALRLLALLGALSLALVAAAAGFLRPVEPETSTGGERVPVVPTATTLATATLTLSPKSASSTAGEQHCVTATARDEAGNPNPDASVVFAVSGANSAGGARLTSANGLASFCYTGTRAGTDTITAFADTDGSGTQTGTEPGDSATNTYRAAAPATLTLAPAAAVGPPTTEHCLTATVRDSFGNPTPNVSVRFSATGANTAGGLRTTGAVGRATFCYTGTNAGTDTIRSFADTDGNGTQNGTEPGDTASMTWRAGPPASLTLAPSAATNPAGSQHCLTATVRDSLGNPTPDITVRFAVTGANGALGQEITGSNGFATLCYTGTNVGTDTIRAFADTDGSGSQNGGEPADTATNTYRAAAPASLTLAPATATSVAGTEHCVTATVRDAFGNPNPNVSVRFSVTGANTAGGPQTTGPVGRATFCYTGTNAGTDTIRAFADTDANGVQNGSEPSDSATKTYTPAPPATLTLAPPSATNNAGVRHCVTASVRDAFGNANPGEAVRFSVTGANTASGQQTTGPLGQATFCYTGTKAGTDTIRAFADIDGSGAQNGGEPGDTATKTYRAAAPATLTLLPATASSVAGTEHCLVATVHDSFGNPNPGVTVRFSVTGANTAGGPQTTGPGGRATFCYTGTKAGTDTIRAFADTDANGVQNGTEPGDSATKTYRPAAPASLTLSPPSATNTAGVQHCVTAAVRDAFANANPGVSVRFMVTGANTASGTQTTGPLGQATFCYTGTKTGTDAIAAFADTDGNGAQNGSEPGGTATKTYVAAAPATLSLTPPSATSVAGTEHCLTATVRDSFGNATPGVTVRFAVTGRNTANGPALTNAAGQASFCYTGTRAGIDTIASFADTDRNGAQDGTEPGDSSSKTYTPAAPARLTLAPATDTNPAGAEHCVAVTVRDAFGNPNPNVVVRFSVTGPNTAAGQKTTAPTGSATFCYTGTRAGTDTINAFADTDRSGDQNGGEPAGSASNTYRAAAPATLALVPQTASKPAGAQHCLTATVRDNFTNPSVGVIVRFLVADANRAGGSVLSDALGQASFCYTGTSAGTDAITAYADTDRSGARNGSEPGDSATKTTGAAAPDSLTLSPQSASTRAGDQHCVSAAVRDTFQNATPDVNVVFTVSQANSAGGTRTTGSAGQAVFCYAGTNAGADTITAFADTNANGVKGANEPDDSATNGYRAAAPATLTLSPQTATKKSGEEHCAIATVRDAFGNPTPGMTIRFSVTGANTASGQQTTAAAGGARYCYTGTRAGVDTVTAFADTDGSGGRNGGEPGDTVTRTYVAAAPATLALAPQSGTKAAGTEHCLTATVRDVYGNPARTVTVRLSVTGANPASAQKTTGATGQATYCYTGTSVGSDTITAFADTDKDGTKDASEPQDTATRSYVAAAPATLALTSPTGAKTVGTERCFTVAVSDAFGNPVRSVTVRFSVSGANTAGGQKTTGVGGQASFCYTGTKAGNDTISAFADTDESGSQNGSEPQDSLTRTYVADEASRLTLAPSTNRGPAGTEHCATATVRDAFGNLVRAVTVRFSVTGANPTGGQSATGPTGQASFCYTGTSAGDDAISAFADTDGGGTQNGSEPSASAGNTYVAASPATIALSPQSATNSAGTRHCITATVSDAFGNRVRGVSIRFSVTGTNSSSGQQATDSNGQADLCYTGNTVGNDTMTAFADTDDDGVLDGGEPDDSAANTYEAAAPATLSLTPAVATGPVGTQHCLTATARDEFGNVVRDVTVRFSVTGANTATGQPTTGVDGRASFCYTGTSAGTDTINAFADTDASGAQNGTEPGDSATNTYVAAS